MAAGEPRGIAGLVRGPLTAVARGADVELFAWSRDGEHQVHAWLEEGQWASWHKDWVG